jgi:hypothetical protein
MENKIKFRLIIKHKYIRDVSINVWIFIVTQECVKMFLLWL